MFVGKKGIAYLLQLNESGTTTSMRSHQIQKAQYKKHGYYHTKKYKNMDDEGMKLYFYTSKVANPLKIECQLRLPKTISTFRKVLFVFIPRGRKHV